MPDKIIRDLKLFADELDAQERFGKAADSPEGSRFIQMSDTMAQALAKELRDIHLERLKWLSGVVFKPDGTEGSVEIEDGTRPGPPPPRKRGMARSGYKNPDY
jgi:hypothetical protein